MRAISERRERMLNHPTYWVEGMNGLLYDAIVSYMKKHNMKQKDLAKHLSLSPGRVSQILNDGDINFSMEKIVEIALKVDKFPVFAFEDKQAVLEKENELSEVKRLFLTYDRNEISRNFSPVSALGKNKVVPLKAKSEVSTNFAVSHQFIYSV